MSIPRHCSGPPTSTKASTILPGLVEGRVGHGPPNGLSRGHTSLYLCLGVSTGLYEDHCWLFQNQTKKRYFVKGRIQVRSFGNILGMFPKSHLIKITGLSKRTVPQRNTPGLSSSQGAQVCWGRTQGGCLQSWLDAGTSGGRARPVDNSSSLLLLSWTHISSWKFKGNQVGFFNLKYKQSTRSGSCFGYFIITIFRSKETIFSSPLKEEFLSC